jgi:ectoine hydroxylase-related dioxygenase (phytanoyl-CoA dioxygenase family)
MAADEYTNTRPGPENEECHTNGTAHPNGYRHLLSSRVFVATWLFRSKNPSEANHPTYQMNYVHHSHLQTELSSAHCPKSSSPHAITILPRRSSAIHSRWLRHPTRRVLFPGFPGPGGWHVDGSNFHHRLESKEQALVTLYLFSDIEPGDGGTALFRGSHHETARILRDAEPEGLTLDELMEALPVVEPEKIAEITGRAGDIAFLHPFLIHGFSANLGSRVRFACNPQYPFKAEMNLNRADGAHSPVEEAIRMAIL